VLLQRNPILAIVPPLYFPNCEKGRIMTTRQWLRAALPALLMLGGCAGSEYFTLSYWQRDSSGNTTGINVTRTAAGTHTTLAGSPDDLAVRFKTSLSRLGLQCQVTSDSAGIRITSTTPSGKQLSVSLKREQAGSAARDYTVVELEWNGDADGQVESELLRLVASTPAR
jgi:hypothetical protein